MLINISLTILISCLLVLSPIFYGSVFQWSKNSIVALVYLIFSIWLVSLLLKKEPFRINTLYLLPLLIFIFLCIFQTLSIPNFIHKILSNESYIIWDDSRKLLSEVGPYYSRDWFTLSIYPYATTSSLSLFASYILFGFFISKYINSKSRLYIVIIPIILVSALESMIGIYQSSSVYGITHSQGAHGTFVNKNHYAGLLELIIPLLIGFGLSFNNNWLKGKKSLARLLITFNTFKQILIFILVFLTILALILSKSRMGIISIILALFLLFTLLSYISQNYKHIVWFCVFTILFLITLIFIIDINPILQRFHNITSNQRFLVWKDCIHIISDFHLFGSGLGTFQYIYPLYKENLKAAVDYHYAHNDYIHLLVETGLIGFSCLMTALIILTKDVYNFLSFHYKTENSYGFFITLGAFSGVVSILVHSLADFNLHIPSNALYFSTMIGIIYGINSGRENKKIVSTRRKRVSSVSELRD